MGAKAATVGMGVVQGGHDGMGAEVIFAAARVPVRDRDRDKDALEIEAGEVVVGVGVIAGEGRVTRDEVRIVDRAGISRTICPKAFTSI